MTLLLLVLVSGVAGFALGSVLPLARAHRYRSRWQEALALMQGGEEGPRWRPTVEDGPMRTYVFVTDGHQRVKVGQVGRDRSSSAYPDRTFAEALDAMLTEAEKTAERFDALALFRERTR